MFQVRFSLPTVVSLAAKPRSQFRPHPDCGSRQMQSLANCRAATAETALGRALPPPKAGASGGTCKKSRALKKVSVYYIGIDSEHNGK